MEAKEKPNMTNCPKCGQRTLAQSMRADVCINDDCDYSDSYPDAYASEDPGGDFREAYDLK